MSQYTRRFFFSLLVVSLFSVQPILAWAPTHKVESKRGSLFLRTLGQGALMFRFSPVSEAGVHTFDDSPLWDPDFLADQSFAPEVVELGIGEGVDLGGGARAFCFLDPVSGRFTLEVRYRDAEETLTRTVALEVSSSDKPFRRVLTIRAPFVDHLYGLGEQFPNEDLGKTHFDLKGKVRHSGWGPDSFETDPLGVYGNSLTPLAGGNVANALFPVLYLADEAGSDAMIFVDNPIDSRWDFRRTPWTVGFRGGEVSGAIAWGAECEELRSRYLSWTGNPPVPPRKAFGLWVSEYGFENWDEIKDKAASLKERGFAIDGFVLDLQWFGGIESDSPNSQMGHLAFDTENFPDPATEIAQFAKQGLGLILIEESYIASGLSEYADLAQRGFLVKSPTDPTQPHTIDRNPWWGLGSMIDYTDSEAGAYWHQWKREPLIDLGIMGHWTDLGEPEVFRKKGKAGRGGTSYQTPLYKGGKEQLEVNNIFALSWARSIFDGYGNDGHQAGPRPFVLGRTGTSGIQRFGASLWSGDIASNWRSLRSHYVAQSHMSLSGVDYYGSDVGGFFRAAYEPEEGGFSELYSRWFAAACLTDIPLRPHTMNLGNKYETSPDRVGDVASNLKNLRLRYRLIPYLYSAAYEAWQNGSPVVSPAALLDGTSEALAVTATVKRIGPSLLGYLVLEPGSLEMECQLPAGRWYDFASGRTVAKGKGSTVVVPTRDASGRFVTPLFAKEGSVIALGSADTSEPDLGRLEIAVFPGAEPSSCKIFHDDGTTEAYRGGDFAVTQVSQSPWRGRFGQVTVAPVEGAFRSRMPERRDLVIHLAYPGQVLQASVDGQRLAMTREDDYWTVTLPQVPLDSSTVVTFE